MLSLLSLCFLSSESHFLIRKYILKVDIYYSYGYFLKLLLETFNVGIKGNMLNEVIKLTEMR